MSEKINGCVFAFKAMLQICRDRAVRVIAR